LYSAGSSFRVVRSPDAPKITMMQRSAECAEVLPAESPAGDAAGCIELMRESTARV